MLMVCFMSLLIDCFFFFSSRRRHTRSLCDWSSDVCSSDLPSGSRKFAVYGDLTYPLLYHHTENFLLPLGHDEVVHMKRTMLNKTEDLSEFDKFRSEERRVGKECRARGSPYHEKKKEEERRA